MVETVYVLAGVAQNEIYLCANNLNLFYRLQRGNTFFSN